MTTKLEFFKLATDAKVHYELDWVVSTFTLTRGEPPTQYPYCVSSDATGYYYTDPEGQKVKIDDAPVGSPIYTYRDEIITLKPGMVANLQQEVQTTYGEWLTNLYFTVYPFGDKINYIAGPIKVSMIEKIMAKNFCNDPADLADAKRDEFYVSEYKKFSRAVFFVNSLSQIFTISDTEKTILPPPGSKELREKLLAENKDSLHDAVTIAKIEKALIDHDAAWRKGDPGERFMITKKLTDVARKRTTLIYGAETGADENANRLKLIDRPLIEGWDIEKFPDMCTTSRLGSYSRGAETMMGGVETKWLQRAAGNLSVTVDDCGTTLGIPTVPTQARVDKLLGMSLLVQGKTVRIKNPEDAGPYLGKFVMVRSPMYCKAQMPDRCKICVGDRLASTPYALGSAVSAYGSTFLAISLAAAHSKGISLEKLDIQSDLYDLA